MTQQIESGGFPGKVGTVVIVCQQQLVGGQCLSSKGGRQSVVIGAVVIAIQHCSRTLVVEKREFDNTMMRTDKG